MKAEKQSKVLQASQIQPKQERSKLGFVDNRLLATVQTQLINNIQKKIGHESHKKVVQWKMNPFDLNSYYKTTYHPVLATYNSPSYGQELPNTGASSTGGTVTLTNLSGSTSDPANLKNMGGWINYEGNVNFLKEKDRDNTLTRMHVINGQFFGESKPLNMLLGSMASNNSNQQSHYHQVEEPICSFFNTRIVVNDHYVHDKEVRYSVARNFTPPTYLSDRVNDIPDCYPDDKKNYLAWIKEACPSIIYCIAIFSFFDSENTRYVAIKFEKIPMDL